MEPNAMDSSALVVPQPKRMPSTQSLMDDEEFSTNPDPRSRVMSPVNASGPATPPHHPDLDDELAALSTKLVNALNHQTSLDDTLATTRHELDTSHQTIRSLEEKVARQQEMLSGEVWIKKSAAEADKSKLLHRIVEEKKLRSQVEQEKKKIEQELENLTAALFEEANKMVISAKEEAQKEQDAVHRKNDLLKAQLADTEGLLKSQQEQLTELKLVMEQISAERDDRSGTAPSSPGLSKYDPQDDESHALESPMTMAEPLSPTYPTNLTQLLHPVLRNDLACYDDFLALARTSKLVPPRASSGTYSGVHPLIGLATSSSMSFPANASTTSLSTTGAPSSNVSPQSPHTPASTVSNGSVGVSQPLPSLKETKFYKRALTEDVEPTLRLDLAPGLSWLARRSVIAAMTEGTLVVEPVPTSGPFVSISKPQLYPCSLCGESRRDSAHLRGHRFRTSEADSAQRYPLCKYCLGRVRSTCDFLGFLRIIKDGHWRADDADSERAAWEESVRLRDQMFWSRIGGGVVPAAHVNGSAGDKSPRPSQDTSRSSAEVDLSAKERMRTSSSEAKAATQKKLPSPPNEDPRTPPNEDASEHIMEEPSRDNSRQAAAVNNPAEGDSEIKRLSITIPGAFEK